MQEDVFFHPPPPPAHPTRDLDLYNSPDLASNLDAVYSKKNAFILDNTNTNNTENFENNSISNQNQFFFQNDFNLKNKSQNFFEKNINQNLPQKNSNSTKKFLGKNTNLPYQRNKKHMAKNLAENSRTEIISLINDTPRPHEHMRGLGAGSLSTSFEPNMAMHGNSGGCDSMNYTPNGMSFIPKSFNLLSSSSIPARIPVPNAWNKQLPKKMDENIASLLTSIANRSPSVSNMRAPPKARYDNSIRFSFAHLKSTWVREHYDSLLHRIADSLPNESQYHILEKIPKGYVDVVLHTSREFQDFVCAPLEHAGCMVKVIKTRSSKDTSMWIHFADLPPSLRPKDVQAAIVCGLQQYGKVIEFTPHTRPGLPEKFGVPTASACIIPFEKYLMDVSLIPRMAVLSDHPEMFQVNPESARPHCVWCNTLGHVASNCRAKIPPPNQIHKSGSLKRPHQVRDAVNITPTQWLPSNICSTEATHELYSKIIAEATNNGISPKSPIQPLAVGEPTIVNLPEPSTRRTVSKKTALETTVITATAPKVGTPLSTHKVHTTIETPMDIDVPSSTLPHNTHSCANEFALTNPKKSAKPIPKPSNSPSVTSKNSFDLPETSNIVSTVLGPQADMMPPEEDTGSAMEIDDNPDPSTGNSRSLQNSSWSLTRTLSNFITPLSGGEDE